MHEYYKMGRICAVAMEITESVSSLRERHDNLLQEPDDRINILIPSMSVYARCHEVQDLTVLTVADIRIRNSC
jgi:hypothetical protein